MKKSYTLMICISIVIFIAMPLSFYAQTFQWAKIGYSQGFEWGNGLVTDDSSNVYVVGQFEYTSNFSGVNLVSKGQHDIFVAKYGPDGTLKWIRAAGGDQGDAGAAIGIDDAGNVYITGEFESKVFFTPTDSFISQGNNNIFLAKYSNNGTFQWARSMGSSNDERAKALYVAPNGDCYMAGQFGGTANFNGATVTSSGGQDVFVAKYNSSGSRQWVKKAGGTRDDRGRGITADLNGNIFVTATYTQSANVGGTNISSTGRLSSFLAKYSPSTGNLSWVRTHNGNDTTRIAAVTTDLSGNIYVTGYFGGTTTWGSTSLTSLGSTDMFFAKYNSSGTLQWIKRGGGTYEDDGKGIVYDPNKNLLYITGMFDYQATFGNITVNSVANRDIYIAAYNTNGDIQWVRTAGGRIRDFGLFIDVDTAGNIYTTGTVNDTAIFDSHTIIGTAISDCYVAKLSPAPAPEPTVQASALSANNSNCNDAELSWTNGNGVGRLVIGRAGGPVNNFPVDGQLYNGSSTFGNGSHLGGGNYVVYKGTGDDVTVTGLTPGTTYHFTVIEYSGYNSITNYRTSSAPSATYTANSFSINVNASAPALCTGQSSTLQASGGLTYQWSPSTYLSSSSGSSVVSTPTSSITYTVTGTDNNGCQSVATVTVNVNPLPNVQLGSFSSLCSGGSAITLTGGTPSGGTYSGTGVSHPQFNPSVAGTGTHTITYTFTDNNNCTSTSTSSIVVNATPNVTVSSFGSLCENASSVQLTQGSPSGGTYSGTGVSGTTFNPATAGTGTHQIQYSYTSNGCSGSASGNITVLALPAVTISPVASMCSNASPVTLSVATPSGGTYSGPGVTGTTFNPSTAGAGTHQLSYQYTNGSGCSNTASTSVTVHASPSAAMTALNPVCLNATPFTLTNGSPSGGVYSGPGVSGSTFNPSAAGTGTHTITYTVMNGNNCVSTAQANITVNPPPVVALSALPSACVNGAPVTLSGGTPAGGTYSGPGVSGGIFSPSVAGTGTHQIQYTYTNGCSGSATANLTVNALPTVSIGSLAAVCANSPSVTLNSGTPSGGTYSGPGVTGNSFNPQSAGAGTHQVTYQYTNSNGCSNSASTSIVVNAIPATTLSSLAAVCQNQPAFTLTNGSPAGGVYSGPGVTGNSFNPSAAGAGTHTITYTYTNANNCSSTAQTNITVNPPPVVSLGILPSACINGSSITLISGTPAGGTYSGPGVSAGSFNPSVAGIGTHPIQYSYSAGGCSGSATSNITVNPLPVVTMGSLAAVCSNGAAVTLNTGSPAGGSYSGTGVTGNSFNPSVAGTGTHQVTYQYTNSNGCSNSASTSITVHASPVTTVTPLAGVCENAPAFTLNNGSPAGGVYSGNGVTGSLYNPAISGPGSHTITYTYTNSNNCSSSAQTNIFVNQLPVVTLPPVALCISNPPVNLTGGTPSGGTYSGTGVSGNIFSPAVAGIGNHTITYNYTDGNGCSGSATATYTVYTQPNVTLNFAQAICDNYAPVTLTGGSPAGGTYSGQGVSGNVFNPSIGAGNYLITYQYTDATGCGSSAQATLTVHTGPTASLGSFSPVCQGSAPVTLTGGMPAGGTYSGSHISAGTFDPATAGTFTVTYNYTDGNGCMANAQSNILVRPLPTVTFPTLPVVCDNASPVILSGGTPAGGSYSGTNVSAGIFYPAVGGAGTYPLSYNYTDANGCSNSAQSSITVNTAPVVSLASFPPVCMDAGSIALSGGSPAGGIYSGPNVSGNVFTLSAPGTYNIRYDYTDANGCGSSATESILVNDVPVVNLGPDVTLCADAILTLDAGSGMASYQWSNGATTQTVHIDSAGLGIGTHTVSVLVTDNNSCSSTDAMLLTFDVCNSIEDHDADRFASYVYPNPFNHTFTIMTTRVVDIRLYDVSGRLIKIMNDVSGSVETGKDLTPGVYFVDVFYNDIRRSYKVIKAGM